LLIVIRVMLLQGLCTLYLYLYRAGNSLFNVGSHAIIAAAANIWNSLHYLPVTFRLHCNSQ